MKVHAGDTDDPRDLPSAADDGVCRSAGLPHHPTQPRLAPAVAGLRPARPLRRPLHRQSTRPAQRMGRYLTGRPARLLQPAARRQHRRRWQHRRRQREDERQSFQFRHPIPRQ